MKVEKLTSNKVRFSFDVTAEEFDQALDYSFETIKDKVEIKGFRKGHVSRKIYENHYGVESLFEEAINQIFHLKFHEATAQDEYQLVGNPKIDLDFTKLEAGKPFSFSFEIAVKPDVKLGEYKGIEVEKLSNEVTDEEINAKIEEQLNQNVTLEPKTEGSLTDGDTAIFDFEGFHNGEAFEGGKAENYELEIGSNQFIPGFEEQMVGMKPGEEKDVEVTFPEQYHAENLAGEDAVFKVKLHEIKQKVTPELNDEWVKTLGIENVNTVAEYKENIKENLEKAKEQHNKNLTLEKALEKIAENTEVDIPVEMVDYEVDQALQSIEAQAKQFGLTLDLYISLTGMTEEELKEQIAKDAELRILNSLIIEQIAKEEDYEISDKEVEEKYEELSKQYGMEVEDVKIHIRKDLVKMDISFSKAIKTIVENLKYV